jgi:serine/threonine protein kinase
MRWLGTSAEFRRETFPHLVDYLQLLHACGYAHTDIHPDNLVMRDEKVVAIDYGSIAPLYQPCMYRGNVVCASDRVLRELHSGKNLIPIFPADDLHSLVRCVFMLLVPEVGRIYFEESLRFARGYGGF